MRKQTVEVIHLRAVNSEDQIINKLLANISKQKRKIIQREIIYNYKY